MARKLFDCFLFFNELDMLEVRLRETSDAVDHFVLVESTLTFQGKPKPLTYQQNASRYAAWADKIIHVVVADDDIQGEPGKQEWWRRESYQRNQVLRGLSAAAPDDLVMVSDVDEIARPEVLLRIKSTFRPGTGYLLYQRMYYGQFNRRDINKDWDGPRIVAKRDFRSGQRTRRLKSRAKGFLPHIGLGDLGVRARNLQMCGSFIRMIEVPDAGWHFSSVGSYDNWRSKVDAFSHPECKEWAAYKSADGYRQWLESLSIDPPEALPKAVRDEPRLAPLIATPPTQ